MTQCMFSKSVLNFQLYFGTAFKMFSIKYYCFNFWIITQKIVKYDNLASVLEIILAQQKGKYDSR